MAIRAFHSLLPHRLPPRVALYRVALLLLVSLSLCIAGCSSGGGGGDDSDDEMEGEVPTPPPPTTGGSGSSSVFALGATADNTGRAAASFQLPEFTNKFSVTAEAGGGSIRIVSVENDRGNEYVAPGGQEISFARDFSPFVKAMSAPSRDFDPEVLDFASYTAVAETTTPGAAVVFTVNTKADPNLANGNARINIFLVGNAAQRSGAARSIDAAIARMSSILQLAGGVIAQVTEIDIDGPDVLPDPTTGSDFYLGATSAAASPALNLFIGGDVAVGGGDVLGISSDIPGPPNPSRRSVVAVSLFTSAGPDGTFSEDETRLFGETLAHELGHFMGLFHPVDLSGAALAATDPLPDTRECSTTANCLNDEELVQNLMFPFPVPLDEAFTETIPQDRLTTQQRGVVNRYIVVD